MGFLKDWFIRSAPRPRQFFVTGAAAALDELPGESFQFCCTTYNSTLAKDRTFACLDFAALDNRSTQLLSRSLGVSAVGERHEAKSLHSKRARVDCRSQTTSRDFWWLSLRWTSKRLINLTCQVRQWLQLCFDSHATPFDVVRRRTVVVNTA